MTDGGCDYTFECIGNVATMRSALEACVRGWGKISFVFVVRRSEGIRFFTCEAWGVQNSSKIFLFFFFLFVFWCHEQERVSLLALLLLEPRFLLVLFSLWLDEDGSEPPLEDTRLVWGKWVLFCFFFFSFHRCNNQKGRTELPGLVEEYMSGKLKVDNYVTGTFELEQINDGFHELHAGRAIRSIINVSKQK